jgi:hypothetical protein
MDTHSSLILFNIFLVIDVKMLEWIYRYDYGTDVGLIIRRLRNGQGIIFAVN